MKDLYPIATVGRLRVWWDRTAELVGIGLFDQPDHLAAAIGWNEEPTASDLAQIADQWSNDFGPLDADEWRFLIEQAASVEAHMEHAERDIREHGEAGITY